MEQVQPELTQPAEDGFSQFFIEQPPSNPGIGSALSSDAQEVLANLLNAYRRLRAASYRIGRLEGQLQKYRRLSRTLITQAAASNVAVTNIKQLSQSTGNAPAVLTVPVRRLPAEFGEFDDETSWWQAITETLFGSDHSHPDRNTRGRKHSSFNYYDLIRDSVHR